MKRLQGMELFVEVAKTCNFGRAAENLGIPKSTVSRQVAELERSLGLRLISRTTRKVQLTEAGEIYFARCQRIVADAQIAHEELQNLVQTPSGPLRVNMPADFGTEFLAEAFLEFSQLYPDVTLYLDLANQDHAERVFQTCDISIKIGAMPDSTLIARLLGQLKAYLYASPAYLARHGIPKHPDDLKNHECIEFRADNSRTTSWPLSRHDTLIEINPGTRFSVNSMAMVRSLASLGAGIAIMAPSQNVLQDVAEQRLQRVLPDWHAGPFPVFVVTDTRLLPAKTRIFIEFLVERLRDGKLSGGAPAPLNR
jgi:LysR family transcriptional regulator for bpeEF and oprC